jgi:predicted lipoprotein with Yx(FWY)xxD motif
MEHTMKSLYAQSPSSRQTAGARPLRSAGLALALALTLTVSGCAMFGSGVPVSVVDGVLVDSNRMTLYTFDKDPVGKSACVAGCAKNWPPLVATASDRPSGAYTIITRDDGSLQWALKGKPLYTYFKDAKPGDRVGDGWNMVWSLARP